MPNNRKISDSLVSRTKIYLVIILLLLIVLCVLNKSLIVPSIIIYWAILSYSYYANNKRKSKLSEQLQDLTLSVDSAAKSSLIKSPFPLVILETNGNIIWRSVKFTTEFANIDINNVAMIGGAGYSYPKYYISKYTDNNMDVIEIDEKITEIAKNFFFFDKLINDFNLDKNNFNEKR